MSEEKAKPRQVPGVRANRCSLTEALTDLSQAARKLAFSCRYARGGRVHDALEAASEGFDFVDTGLTHLGQFINANRAEGESITAIVDTMAEELGVFIEE